MVPFIDAVKPEEIDCDTTMKRFYTLYPDMREWISFGGNGNTFPIVPCVRKYMLNGMIKSVLFCTSSQAKRLKKYRKNDLIFFESFGEYGSDWERKKDIDHIVVI